jgi:DNA ligase D-like protein (predicted ligase)
MPNRSHKQPAFNRDKAKSVAFPQFKQPMLATLTDDYFDDPEWIYERKLDGIRCLLLKDGTNIRLMSRNNKDLSATFPEVTELVPSLCSEDLVADGEIVAFSNNITSFSSLQARLPIRDDKSEAAQTPRVYLYLFDLPYFGGLSLENLPLTARKKALKENLSWADPFRYTPHRRESGKKYLAEACNKGWEGVIAKHGGSTYIHGRSRQWLKFKCASQQELVIGGFTEPEGERIGFGALLVGYYQNGKLRYAGKVGTGFNDTFLKTWRKKFDKIASSSSPFENYTDRKNNRNHWIHPKYVGEFRFTEWTKGNKLRHPSFLGLRFDKVAKEVRKESPDENSRH